MYEAGGLLAHRRPSVKSAEYWTCKLNKVDFFLISVQFLNDKLFQLEKEIENFAIRAQKELILLHKVDGPHPKNTVNWLNIRGWCTSHHHIRCPKSFFAAGDLNVGLI